MQGVDPRRRDLADLGELPLAHPAGHQRHVDRVGRVHQLELLGAPYAFFESWTSSPRFAASAAIRSASRCRLGMRSLSMFRWYSIVFFGPRQHDHAHGQEHHAGDQRHRERHPAERPPPADHRRKVGASS